MSVPKGQTDKWMDVLAAIRAPLEQYPPSVFQVELLVKSGLRVGVVDLAHPRCGLTSFAGNFPVERIHAARHTLSPQETFPPAPIRLWRGLKFAFHTRQALKRFRPKIVIAYDAQACHVVGRVMAKRDRPRLICHIHDLAADERVRRGLGSTLADRHYLQVARSADLVVQPDANRAKAFMQQANLRRLPAIVMNCPLLVGEIPKSTLRDRLGKLYGPDVRTVFFQGWIGEDRGLEILVQSMKYWPLNSLLVLVGPVSERYRQSLLGLADALHLSPRVVFIPMVTLADLAGVTAGADLAWGAFPATTDDLNFKFMAGASNKRFMYMSLAVAQIANPGPGMCEIFERTKCARLVNPGSITEVGNAVAALLADDSGRRELGQNGRKAHLNEFNYERQFAPVLEQIVAWSRS